MVFFSLDTNVMVTEANYDRLRKNTFNFMAWSIQKIDPLWAVLVPSRAKALQGLCGILWDRLHQMIFSDMQFNSAQAFYGDTVEDEVIEVLPVIFEDVRSRVGTGSDFAA